MESAIPFLFNIVILIFLVVIHEVAHGYAALAMGDKTAQYAGRLTLNPFKHLDPFGSIVIPTLSYLLGGVIFGWAKPVPYNPYNLRNQKWGPALVAVAGPLANLTMAIIFGLVVRFLPDLANGLPGFFVLNFMTVSSTIVFISLLLAFFNLIPIPPLDGSKILFAVLPYQWRNVVFFLERYGLIIFLIFILFFAHWLMPVILLFFRLITGNFPI